MLWRAQDAPGSQWTFNQEKDDVRCFVGTTGTASALGTGIVPYPPQYV